MSAPAPSHRSWFPWIALALFAVAGACVVLFMPHQADQDIHTFEQLTQALDGLGLHVIRAGNANEIFLATDRKANVRNLFLDPKEMEAWQGIVIVKMEGKHAVLHDEEFQTWGESGLRINNLFLFGDRTILERIKTVLRPE